MKANKKLMQMFKDMHFDDYMIEQLLSDPAKVQMRLKQLCKSPHSKGSSPYDSKTKYGLLYTTFNGLKTKCDLPNYDVRQFFVETYIDNKKFNKLFKAWKKSGFIKEWKPSFHIIDKDLPDPITKDNIKLDLYENTIKMAHSQRGVPVTYLRDGLRVTEIYNSVREAARNLEISESTIRNHLSRSPSKFSNFRKTIDKHWEILNG